MSGITEAQRALLDRLINAGMISQTELEEFLNQFKWRLTEQGEKWGRFFGRLCIWDSNFNSFNFQLGDDPGDEAEEYQFGNLISGQEAITEFLRLGHKPASLWAQGRYIVANPQKNDLAGIGSQWQRRRDAVACYPIYGWLGDRGGVCLRDMDV